LILSFQEPVKFYPGGLPVATGRASSENAKMSRTRVKICGVTNPDDVRRAADAGADAIGFNFYPRSPRFVDPRNMAPLLQALPPLVDAVGVFVELKIRQISALAFQLGLHSVQTFADMTDADDPFLFRLIAAFRLKDRGTLDEINTYVNHCRQRGRLPAALLLDAHVEGQLGGTGKIAPWELLADFRPGVPLILAGGLTAETVADAIRIVRPFAVDVASGVESAPGQKDPEKLRRFVEAVRMVD
jgi:phosphoribosylanthranilate isomerase